MQISSDQFNFPFLPTDSEQGGSAEVDKPINNPNGTESAKEMDNVPVGPETREDRVNRVRASLGAHLWRNEVTPPVTTEQPPIEKYMKHLGDMGLVLEDFRNQELHQ